MTHNTHKTRIAFDTNIWISFTIGKRLETLRDVLLCEKFQIYICPQIIEEYLLVTMRPEIRKFITLKRISDTIELIETFAENQPVKSKIILSRDPDDNFLLAFSKDNKLGYLITGDKDLLVIGSFHNTRIISYSMFYDLYFKKEKPL